MTPIILTNRLQSRYRRFLCAHMARRNASFIRDQPIISFCFDDFPASALDTGGSILREYGFTGTYYAALGLAGAIGPVGRYFSEADLPRLLMQGHELGCHTYDHYHAWTTSPRDYETSILRNRTRLQQLLPGEDFSSHSYPISLAHPRNKTIVRKYFACARGGGQTVNHHKGDATYLSAVFLEKTGDPSVVKKYIDRAAAANEWLILATHDVCDTPSRFGYATNSFAEIVRHVQASRLAVLPISRAFKHLTNSEC